MTDRAHPPVTGSLEFWRAWAKEHGGTVEVVHRNPRGVISIVQGGMHHVYHFDKYGKGDGKYSWGSSFPVDFLSQMTAAYTKAHPNDASYADIPTYREEDDIVFGGGKRK